MSDILLSLEIEDFGTLKIELYPKIAPNTVSNFMQYVNSNFYDGLIFHRIIKGFMIQGGANPKDSKRPIKGEFAQNGFKNDLKHTKGVLSMARTMDRDSASSQFFIMHQDAPHLDGSYAAFGKVIEGLDVIDKVASVKTDAYDQPLKDVKIKSITLLQNEVSLDPVVYA